MILTNHFRLEEFASHDRAPTPIHVQHNLLQLCRQLEIIRHELGAPVIINSGYRSQAHNKKIGGAKHSYHLCGMAADIRTQFHTPQQVFDTILRLIQSGEVTPGGLKKYDTFVHYDIRGILVLF